jgi:4'-phosphopantetheinyl transferase EntD
MMSPEPHFNAVANSDAELKDFKNMENLTEAAIVRLLFCLKRSAFRRSFLFQIY